MTRWTILFTMLLLPVAIRAAEPDPKELAQEILDRGASLFQQRDAQALAASYTDDAELTLVAKDKDTGNYKAHVTRGRDEIQKLYEKLFADAESEFESKNHVELAHYVGEDLLIIHGHFQPDTSKDGEFPFLQVRVKQGENWRILSLQVFVVPSS